MLSRTRLVAAGAAMTVVSLLGVSPALAQGNGSQASRPAIFEGVLWADGELFGTNLNGPLPAPKANNRQSFDDLYQVINGVEGQRPVAEAAPGPGYNGGRWAVVELTWTDPAQAVELTSGDQISHYLAAGAVTAHEVGLYFSCPLLPVK